MAEAFDFFGGVDFSGAREPLSNLWTALGREEEGKLHIVSLRPHAYRADLGAFVGGGWRGAVEAGADSTVLWGVDFPFSLPADAAHHLLDERAQWRRLLPWIADRPADEVRDAVPEPLRGLRLTDSGLGPSPFDLRVYKLAVEGIRWLHELRENADISVHPQATSGAGSTLIEVSPAATIQELGLPRRRAPGRPGEIRARAAAMRTFLTFATPEIETVAVTLEDPWDAMVGCLTAYLAREDLDQPFRLATHPRSTIELEGWIYRAPATLP
ncbi:MAG: hypothetical protein KY464_18080 [Gemmatimonadetes bacterium]|nr:hypothetical protein [Gemmatimonadota bacterium]